MATKARPSCKVVSLFSQIMLTHEISEQKNMRSSVSSVVDDFIVLVHGIDSPLPTHSSKGQAMSHFSIALRQQAVFCRSFVLTSASLYGHTFEGVDVLGERLLQEIEQAVEAERLRDAKKRVRFSIVGHSLGGIVARYVIALLDERGYFDEGKNGVFLPVSYMSFGSPHLSVRRAETWLGWIQDFIGETLFRGTRTLDQLMLRDGDGERNLPLLVQMSEEDGRFVRALRRFQHLTAVSAVNFDHQVTHSSSSITSRNQFNTKYSYVKYAASFLPCGPRLVDRLAGFSGFSSEYDNVLKYFSKSEKALNVVEMQLPSPQKTDANLRLVTYSEHSQRYVRHPHESGVIGDDEIENSHPLVQRIARGLWTLQWRRIDFELWTQFAHDALIGRPTIHCSCLYPRYGWKCVVKCVKVLAMDHLIEREREFAHKKE